MMIVLNSDLQNDEWGTNDDSDKKLVGSEGR